MVFPSPCASHRSVSEWLSDFALDPASSGPISSTQIGYVKDAFAEVIKSLNRQDVQDLTQTSQTGLLAIAPECFKPVISAKAFALPMAILRCEWRHLRKTCIVAPGTFLVVL